MKKLIISLILFGMLSFATPAKALTNDEIILIKQQINAILLQIIELQKQLLELLGEQQLGSATTTGQVATTTEATTTIVYVPVYVSDYAPVIPEVKKELTINGNCYDYSLGCNFYIYYWENGKKESNEAITISSSDPNGYFIQMGEANSCIGGEWANWDGSQRKGNPITCATSRYLGNAPFGYRASATGTVDITASTNGAEITNSFKIY
jgi:hypothetical protein